MIARIQDRTMHIRYNGSVFVINTPLSEPLRHSSDILCFVFYFRMPTARIKLILVEKMYSKRTSARSAVQARSCHADCYTYIKKCISKTPNIRYYVNTQHT